MNLFVLRTWLEAKFAKDERGASMVEYILLVALIALAVIAAVVFLKDQVNGKFNDAGSKLSSSGAEPTSKGIQPIEPPGLRPGVRSRWSRRARSAAVSGDQRITSFDRVGSIGRCGVEELSEREKEAIGRLSAMGRRAG